MEESAMSEDIIYLLDHEDYYFLRCWWTLWRFRQNINIYVLCCTTGWIHQELAAIYSLSCLFLLHDARIFRIVCTLFYNTSVLPKISRNITNIAILYTVQTLPWKRAVDIIKSRSHLKLITSEMAFTFFPRLQYSAKDFCIQICLLSINQTLKNIKERLTAFGGQQTYEALTLKH